MADYISREYVLKCMGDSFKNAGISTEAKAKMTRWLNKAPAADVVPMDFHERCLQIEIQKRMALEKADVREVVLCKNCKYFYKDEDGYTMCDNSEGYDHVTEDDFCSRGADMREDIDGR